MTQQKQQNNSRDTAQLESILNSLGLSQIIDTNVKQLTNQIQKLKYELQDLQRKYASKERQLIKLRKDYKTIQSQLQANANIIKQLQEYNKEILKLANENDNNKQILGLIKKLANQKKLMQEQVEKITKAFRENQRQFGFIKQQNDQIRRRNYILLEQIENKRQQNQKYIQNIATLQLKITNSHGSLKNTYNQTIETTEGASIHMLSSREGEISKQNKVLKQKLQSQIQKSAKIQKKLKYYEGTLIEILKDRERLKKKCSQFQQTIQNLRSKQKEEQLQKLVKSQLKEIYYDDQETMDLSTSKYKYISKQIDVNIQSKSISNKQKIWFLNLITAYAENTLDKLEII